MRALRTLANVRMALLHEGAGRKVWRAECEADGGWLHEPGRFEESTPPSVGKGARPRGRLGFVSPSWADETETAMCAW